MHVIDDDCNDLEADRRKDGCRIKAKIMIIIILRKKKTLMQRVSSHLYVCNFHS